MIICSMGHGFASRGKEKLHMPLGTLSLDLCISETVNGVERSLSKTLP